MLPTGQRKFADGTGVMGLGKGEDPGLLGGPNVITCVLKGGDPFPAESDRRRKEKLKTWEESDPDLMMEEREHERRMRLISRSWASPQFTASK